MYLLSLYDYLKAYHQSLICTLQSILLIQYQVIIFLLNGIAFAPIISLFSNCSKSLNNLLIAFV